MRMNIKCTSYESQILCEMMMATNIGPAQIIERQWLSNGKQHTETIALRSYLAMVHNL